jgi:hypothetical protein
VRRLHLEALKTFGDIIKGRSFEKGEQTTAQEIATSLDMHASKRQS